MIQFKLRSEWLGKNRYYCIGEAQYSNLVLFHSFTLNFWQQDNAHQAGDESSSAPPPNRVRARYIGSRIISTYEKLIIEQYFERKLVGSRRLKFAK